MAVQTSFLWALTILESQGLNLEVAASVVE